MVRTATETLEAYLVEVKRLLAEKNLRAEWIEEIVGADMQYLERAHKEETPPVYAAFEVYITEDDAKREPGKGEDRLMLNVSPKAKTCLQKLVDIGLWGESVEEVASVLVQQQLADKLEAGLFDKR